MVAVGLACASLAAVSLTACGTQDSGSGPTSSTSSSTTRPANVYERQRAEGVTQLLGDLGAALVAGDRARLDALIDPSASTQFRGALHTAADNLSGRERAAAIAAAPATPPTTTTPPTATAATTPPTAATPPATTSRQGASTSGRATPPPTSTSSAPAVTDASRGGGLRLQTFGYRLAPTEDAETLTPAAVQQRLDAQGSSDSWVAPVELHYALGGAAAPGLAEPEIVLNAQMIVARYDDAWKVVGDASSLGEGAAPVTLWQFPGLAARDVGTGGGTSTIPSYPGTEKTVARVADLLPDAVSSVTAFWGPDWTRKAAVVATGTADQFRGLAGSAGTDIAGAAAATVYEHIDQGAKTVVGQRIILTPSVGTLAEPALGVVLRHELTHVAARLTTSPQAPMWITEGVPEYVGRKGTYKRFADAAPELAAAVASGTPPAGLPADAAFAVDSRDAVVTYQSAWSVAAFVAATLGEHRLRALYRSVGSATTAEAVDAAIKDSLGIDRAELVARWQRWLTEQVR